jgi:hypothetical protein
VEFLVEHYWPGVTEESFRLAADRVRASAATLDGLRFLHWTLVPDDEAAFCVFAAQSEQLVAEAYRLAGVPYERILAALDGD